MASLQLEVRSLRKSYGSNSGISDVSLNVEKGTIHGFLGVNGSGKTTTMKCIMGILRKDGGIIMLKGSEYDPADVAMRSRIGFSPELPSYPPYLSGMEVMQVYGRMHGFGRSDGKAEAERLLKSVGLDEAKGKRVGKYSRGMQAKLGVAVAMIGNPELLILDEPTSGMDPVAAANMRKTLLGMKDEGTTVLLSSHLLNEVEKICRNISIINEGKSIAEGPVKEVVGDKSSLEDLFLSLVEGGT